MFIDKNIEKLIKDTGCAISPIDNLLYAKIKARLDATAKPLDSLGIFEEHICRMGAILGSEDFEISNKAVLVYCSDNGVVEEGISQSGQEVTLAVAKALGEGKSSVCKMAKAAGVKVIPVDVGINNGEDTSKEVSINGVKNKKIAFGTKNFINEPAMSAEETLNAIEAGIDMVRECKENGYTLICLGEMGIGNTTTSSAVIAALLGCELDLVVGRGAGLSDEGLAKKKKVIATALEKYGFGTHGLHNAGRNSRNENDGLHNTTFEILSSVGGFDIAALAGTVIGGALYHIPIVLDGVISAAAVLVAEGLCEGVKDYVLASHAGKEAATKLVLDALGLKAAIYADLALGEGTGAVMMCSLLDTAMSVYIKSTSFDDINVEQYIRL